MTTSDHVRTATLVLAKCGAHDPWFPKPAEATIRAWADAFANTPLTTDELIAGVDHAYRTVEGEFRPRAGDIIRHAQQARVVQLRNLPDDRRRAMENANHALQDMGFPPAEAHRISRAIALRNDISDSLTDTQVAELKQRLAVRAEIDSLPARHLTPLAKVLRELADQKAVEAS